ncbi:SAM-dependent methyltransferase [Saccharothrix tamanrassetensis]|uniref:SAM-dependent methyltransferase n=1 Tax=Saccharothrix tamanrassetensis TaxID=1051531 RepID=A0A841CXR4_9PSEU|nr:class I SAM-dependent methyltransferase [Saccharothrix tamanrassetensis]MBB5960735.1 SAM-dependent methyltransferase [Saccharothrix tamanrassetensis]
MVFGSVAREYARYRPGYPPEAVLWAVGRGSGARVLDLGAGTGKLTAAVVAAGHEAIAVEPDSAMLAELASEVPTADAVAGSAEDIPLPDGSVDVVLAGQVLHWVDPDRAYPEISRVLRPGGVVAGLWNSDELRWIERLGGTDGTDEEFDWRGFFPTGLFTDESHRSFANPRPHTVDSLMSTIATHSRFLVLDDAEREKRLSSVRSALIRGLRDPDGEFEVRSRTYVIRATKR